MAKKTMEKRAFGSTTDLDFLYLSEDHQRVFEEILSAIHRRDELICVTGAPGTGKTLLGKCLLEELSDRYLVLLINTPPESPHDMTRTLDEAFVEIENDPRTPIVIFDEAQHLDFRCLDHVKFLSNLERNGEKLLQIILMGQPELAEKLNHRKLIQLDQRIGAKLALGSLKREEVLPYLTHRLSVAGAEREVRFAKQAAGYIWRATSGVPRLINRMANIVVEQALNEEKGVIEVADVKRAASRINACRGDWKIAKSAYSFSPRFAILTLVSASSVGLFLYFLYNLGLGP